MDPIWIGVKETILLILKSQFEPSLHDYWKK